MIDWRGYTEMPTRKIRVDEKDIAARMEREHVRELAADIKETGGEAAHAPVVRALPGSIDLVCGRDRWAAMRLLGAKKVWVHVVDCTDDEATHLELSENIYRRHVGNRSELLAQLVELKKQQIRAEASRDTVAPSEQTIAARARKEVARAAGVKPQSVRMAETRTAARTHSKPIQPPRPKCQACGGSGFAPPDDDELPEFEEAAE